MNEAQKNAIREADNYLKAAGLLTYSELRSQCEDEDGACSVMPLIDDYAKAVHDGDDALCQVLRRTIEASLPTQPAQVSDAEIDWVASQNTRSVDTPTRFVTDVRATVRAILALRPQATPKDTCAQCKKSYRKSEGSIGCQKCAPGIQVSEVEFRKPLTNN